MQVSFSKISFLLSLLLWGGLAGAQVSFTASANRTEIGKNESLTVQFEVNASGSGFQAPSFDGFQVLQGPMRSQSTQIINFERSESMSFSYVLRPTRTGKLTIGPASIKVNGEAYRSQPLTISVSEKSPRSSDPNDPYSIAARNAFIRIFTSKTTMYQGEPFVASYKLFFNTNIGRFDIQNEPDFSSLYKMPIDLKKIDTKADVYEGRRYTSGIIYQMVLIPQHSGTIKPGNLDVEIPTAVPTNRRDFFGRQVTQTIDQTATTQFPTLHVKELPEQGKPSDFSGAVGDYQMSVKLSRDEVGANESVTLTIKLSGHGNIKLVDAPKPEIPSAFEAYDPEYKESIDVDASGMSGTKTYEYLLIPRYGGTYKIPPLSFSYFDPQREHYETIISDEMDVKVTGGSAQPNATGGMASGEKEKVDFIGKDILFIKTDPGHFKRKGASFFGSVAYYSILGGCGAAFAGMLGYFFLFTNRKTDKERLRSQKANKVARQHLSQAKKEMDGNHKEAFYLALTSALWGYFSDKFTIPKSQLSKEVIEHTLREKGIEGSIIQRVMDIMNRAEMARFTSISSSSPQEDYEETASLITQIEKEV